MRIRGMFDAVTRYATYVAAARCVQGRGPRADMH